MSYIEKFLKDGEVEWKQLGEVTLIGTGYSNRQDEDKNGQYPFYVRSQNVLKSSHFQFDETAIIIPGEGGIGDIFHYVQGRYALHQRAYRIKITTVILESKFLYYYMLNSFKSYIIAKSVGATATSIRKPMLESFPIPIPPLSVQEEIVRILDTFTEDTKKLTTELTTELSARKKQYNYYRNDLFSFKERDAEWKRLNEIGEFQRGKRFVRTDMISEGVPCIHYGEMYTHYDTWADKTKSFLGEDFVEAKNLRVAKKGDVVIVAAGETIEDLGKGTAWLGETSVVIHDACFSYRSSLNPKYVAYYTRTKLFHDQIKKHISSGKISAIHSKGLGTVLIPVPSSKEQERIVTILDKFDVLTSSITKELPKEIELRNKQYEYYRDMLLTFSKIN